MQYLIWGVTLGLYAGLGPGPLTAMVVSETLRQGWRAGMVVAMVPMVADTTILLICMAALGQLPAAWANGMGVAGGLWLLYMGWESLLRPVPPVAAVAGTAPELPSLFVLYARGLLTSFLNPQVWLFWLLIGAPELRRAASAHWSLPYIAVAAFVAMLVLSKATMALAVHRGRQALGSRGHRWALAAAGAALAGLGVHLVWQGAAGLWPG